MKKTYLFTGLAALAGIAVLAYVTTSGTAPADDAPAPSAMVNVISLVKRTVPVHLSASGSIVAGAAEMGVALAAPGIVIGFEVTPGQTVAAGQALARVAPDPQSIADLRKAEDAVAAAKAARDHVAALLPEHLATSADLAAATQALSDAQAALAALRTNQMGVSYVILAPFTGTVTSIAAAPGGALPAGTVLLKLVAAGQITALAGLPEADALRVHAGDVATLALLNTRTQMNATVVERAAMLDPQTGLINVTLAPQDAPPLGEPVAVTITAGSVTGYPVPRAAVLSDAQGDYVYQLDARNVAHREAVQVLESDGATSVLAPTLDPRMKLATTGAYQLSDGMTATVLGAGN
jgi:RND family efflux transporter MFP subunit